MTDGLKDAHRDAIVNIFRSYERVERAVLFGSRAMETFTQGSDVDIALFGDSLTTADQSRLATAMEELTIPQRIDLVLYDGIEDAALRKHVQRHGVELYTRCKNTSTRPENSRRFHDQIKQSIAPAALPLGSTAARAIHEEEIFPTTEQNLTQDNWREIPFNEAVQVNPKVKLNPGQLYPYVDMAAVNASSKFAYAAVERKFNGGGSRFHDGDTLMARITPCLENGKIARYRTSQQTPLAHGSTEFIIIRGRPEVTDNNFAYYLTQWDFIREYAIGQMTGTSGRQRVPTESLSHLTIPLLPLSEQRAIAHILGTLDDKIELNRRMNETLEAMARAIFKEWFVDFGPVRAKAEGREPYLLSEIWDLFPSTFDDEGIPESWSYTSLTALSDLNPDSWSKINFPEEIDYVDLANTKWGTIEVTQRFLWRDAPSRAKRILRPGDTIVGLVRPGNGSYSFINDSGLTGSTGFAVLRPRESQHTEVIYLSATDPKNIERLANLADGGAYPAVRPEVVGDTEVIIPPDAVLTRFSDCISSFFDRMEINRRESRALAQARDLLLPRLMSGEVRIIDAEKVVETAIS